MIFDDSSVWVLLLCMVYLVKYYEIDLGHVDKVAVEAIEENLSCADNRHVITELLIPVLFCLHHATHFAPELRDGVGSEVAVENRKLLEAECNLFYNKKGYPLGNSRCTILQLLFKVMPEKQRSNEGLARTCANEYSV
jgi:hypothetical protein